MINKKQKQYVKRRIKRTKKHALLAFVPKKENHYRPHLVRRYGLLAVLVLAIGVQIIYNVAQTGNVLSRNTSITEQGLLQATNERRNETGAQGLQLNGRLSQAAEFKANDMFANQYWGHTSPNGVEPWAWITQTGYAYEQAGENLARNFATAQATVSGWMASPSHKDNMLKSAYTDVGFGIVSGELNGSPTTIVVALYARPLQAAAQTGSASSTVSAATLVSSESGERISLVTRIGIGLQSLSPAAIIGIALLGISGIVALAAHVYSHKLSPTLRKKWHKKYHGIIKAGGLLGVVAGIILLYGGGQL